MTAANFQSVNIVVNPSPPTALHSHWKLQYCSDVAEVRYDVPQGSVWGPFLFLIYVNDICEAVQKTKVKLYADDTNELLFDKDGRKLNSEANTIYGAIGLGVRWNGEGVGQSNWKGGATEGRRNIKEKQSP